MIWEQSKRRECTDGIVGMQGIFVLKNVYTKNLSHTQNLSYTPNTWTNFNVQRAIK